MQLTAPQRPGVSTDVPTALRQAHQAFGHRPAISLLLPDGRQEQSFASLYQWAAKTAHWLQLDHAAEPGMRLGVTGPVGWVPAAAALGAWWLGLTVAVGDGADRADVVIAGPGAHGSDSDATEVFTWDYAFDGSAETGDSFTWTVQEFPDDPPPALGAAGMPAVDGLTQQAALAQWEDDDGALGIDTDGAGWLAATALRPLTVARPTVLLGPGAAREHAAGDRVARWL